jgi:CRISPR-associated protein Csm1
VARKKAGEAIRNINSKLIEYFGARLFVAYGLQECSAEELMSKTDDPKATSIFSAACPLKYRKEVDAYSAEELRC